MEDGLHFFLKEVDLMFFENGRRPHFFFMEDDLIFWKMEDNQIFFKVEDDLKFLVNGRQP